MIENLASARLDAAREQIVASDSVEEHEALLADALEAVQEPLDLSVVESLLAIFGLVPVARALVEGTFADETSQRAMDATTKVATSIGVRSVGTLATLVAEVRRVKALEDRKLAIILERADESTPERLQGMLVGYLTTNPSPLHARAMNEALPEAMASARAAWDKQRSLDFDATGKARLLEQARQEDALADREEVATLLEQMLESLDRPSRILKGILEDSETDPDTRLLATMLVGWMGERDLIEQVLAVALSAPEQDVCWYAVVSASLEPLRTCQALALALADVSWGNPEEPENAWTPRRARATVVSRTLLPELGSPLEAFSLEQFEHAADEELKLLPRRTKLLRSRWQELTAMRAQRQ
ncbi:MAG: hypothetical protein VYE40_19585 [Myxococcota bacterium]|nr:hypothetical protein [Myxococcota bacterium]